MRIGRRRFIRGVAAASAIPGLRLSGAAAAPAYRGPNAIIVRFGGGVRRREVVEALTSHAPFFRNVLAKRGVLIPGVTIAELTDVDTSHAEGTLNILTGRYRAYSRVGDRGLAPLLEPNQPTLFEHLRRAFDVPSHEALLINGENRPQEEYLTYGGHRHYGVRFRSEVLSLYRFKVHKFTRILGERRRPETEIEAARKELAKLRSFDYRGTTEHATPAIERFWDLWRAHYGDCGLTTPRGDQLLTELALWALRELKPRLVMINYQDPDYVHWGNASHYTRAIAVIDQGLERLTAAVDADPFYRDRTVMVIVPDCGRDANPLMAVPFQHHFNSRSAHEIFALVLGTGVVRDRVLDTPVDQTSIAPTIGALMGFRVHAAEGRVLSEIIA